VNSIEKMDLLLNMLMAIKNGICMVNCIEKMVLLLNFLMGGSRILGCAVNLIHLILYV
jgi:hypothetical protein